MGIFSGVIEPEDRARLRAEAGDPPEPGDDELLAALDAVTDPDLDLATAPLEDVVADTMARAEVADELRPVGPDEDEGLDVAGITAVVTIDGAEPQLGRKPCAHTSLTFQNVAGTVDDDEGKPLKWVLKVRVRCSLCGVPFDAVPGSARDPQDHPIGIVFDLLPVEDRELADSLPPHVD